MDLLAHSAVHLLETLFFLGLLGSSVVVLLSAFEDVGEFFLHKDEQQPGSGPRTPSRDGMLAAVGAPSAVASTFAPGMLHPATRAPSGAAKTGKSTSSKASTTYKDKLS